MATIALLNVGSYVDGHDFTGDSNSTRLTLGRVELDCTTFRSGGWTELTGGLRTVEFTQSGHWSADSGLDAAGWTDLGATERVHTIVPQEVPGTVAYFWRSQRFAYQPLGGSVGDLAAYELRSSGATREGVIRGRLAVAPWSPATGAAVTYNSTGQAGEAVELPAVGAGQAVYAAVHVLTAGATVTLELESDSTEDFDDNPTVQATVGPLTAAGGTWVAPITGPITDTWWRVNIDAITGSFVIAVSLGVL